MSKRQEFMDAICAAPEDIDTRLVFADWLDDQGEEAQANFIRAQVELAAWEAWAAKRFLVLPESRQGRRIEQLREYCRQLLIPNFGAWTDGLPEPLVTKQCPSCEDALPCPETNAIECDRCDGAGLVEDRDNVEFRRGFVESISCDLATYLKFGADIVKQQPILEIRLTDREPFGPPSRADGIFSWLREWLSDPGQDRHILPDELHAELPCDRADELLIWQTAEEAHAALSRAAVRLVRRRAGLPVQPT